MDKNDNDIELIKLLEEGHKRHFQLCQLYQTIINQKQTSDKISLKNLRDLRVISKQCEIFDRKLRVISSQKTHVIHARNSEKWNKKDRKPKG